jgi:hypothetical protein
VICGKNERKTLYQGSEVKCAAVSDSGIYKYLKADVKRSFDMGKIALKNEREGKRAWLMSLPQKCV